MLGMYFYHQYIIPIYYLSITYHRPTGGLRAYVEYILKYKNIYNKKLFAGWLLGMVMYLKVEKRGQGTSPLYIPLTGALNPSRLVQGPGDERDKEVCPLLEAKLLNN